MAQRVQMKLNTAAIRAAERAAAARGLALGVEHVLQVSRSRVPLEEGTLERSGTATVDEANLRGAVAYDTPYAVRQHEDLTLRHDDGRQAKYLESALEDERATVGEIIAAQIRRALR